MKKMKFRISNMILAPLETITKISYFSGLILLYELKNHAKKDKQKGYC